MALLLAAALLDVMGAAALAARLLPAPRPGRDRVVAAALLALLLPILLVRVLGAAHALTRPAMAAAVAGAAMAASGLAGARARACAARDARRAVAVARDALTGGAAGAGAWVALGALGLACLAAYLLPVWAWDALNYHLPIVFDALHTQTLREVPTHIPYVNAYPCAIEHFFIACRLLLGDDTWLDFRQAPFAVAACAGVAAMARRQGAGASRAAAYGALFLAVPVVMLQLATDYVDVAVAALLVVSVYFATGPRAPADLALWAIATGLLLGSKPSTPPAVAILVAVVVARGLLARDLGLAVAACALVALLGGERYLGNLAHHGNPIRPVAVEVGPVSLPGPVRGGPLFVLGLPEHLARASWARRLVTSFFAMPDWYIYDMRLGGLGPLVALGLGPVAVVTAPRAWRRGALAAALLAVVAVASPAAHWMRYTLALPAALLAHVAATTERWPRRARALVDLGLAVLAAAGVAQAAPGLTGGGPSLAALLALSPERRAPVVSVDGHEALWISARRLVREGESFAYDASFTFPGQLWRGDPGAGLLFLDGADAAGVAGAIARARVRVLVAGDGLPAEAAVQRDDRRYRLLFRCPVDRCTVYERLDETVSLGDPR